MTIDVLRLSFVVTETILDLQLGTGSAMPLGSLVSEPGYIDTVDTVQHGGAAPLGLQMPWPYRAGNHFWDSYLHDKLPGDAGGKLCFEKLVPLRLPKFVEKIETDVQAFAPASARLGIEGFYYPHGTGLLITATLIGELDFAAAGNIVHSLRSSKVYKSPWPTQAAGSLNLEQLMTAALDQLRKLGFGDGVSGARSAPFSIATVLRGKAVDPDQSLAPDGDIHRLLNGFAGGVPNWQHQPAPPLVAGSTQLDLKKDTSRNGNVLLAAKRGRAVWFPGYFLPPKPILPAAPPQHQLGCYHRNLSVGSLQVESLLMLAAEAESVYAKGALVPASIQRLARIAAGLLARLYSGSKCYKSGSLRAEIAQSAQLEDVNALRQRFGMPPIS